MAVTLALDQALGRRVRAARGSEALIGMVDGLDAVLLVGGIMALVASVLTLVLIRPKDFVQVAAREPEAAPA